MGHWACIHYTLSIQYTVLVERVLVFNYFLSVGHVGPHFTL